MREYCCRAPHARREFLSEHQCSLKCRPRNLSFRVLQVKDNVVGWDGRFVDEKRYEEAFRSCNLSEDFGNYVHAAGVAVGSRGANISGGQKQRVVSRDL